MRTRTSRVPLSRSAILGSIIAQAAGLKEIWEVRLQTPDIEPGDNWNAATGRELNTQLLRLS